MGAHIAVREVRAVDHAVQGNQEELGLTVVNHEKLRGVLPHDAEHARALAARLERRHRRI